MWLGLSESVFLGLYVSSRTRTRLNAEKYVESVSLIVL
jgi:hypothetical protein